MNAVRRFAALMAVYLASVFYCFLATPSAYAYETVYAHIPVNCYEFSESDNLEYKIKIEAETFGAPLPEQDIIEVGENGTGYFDLVITEPGTFVYKIYEIKDKDESIRYDDKNYYVDLYVEQIKDDELAFSVVASGAGGSKAEKIEFKNKFIDENGINLNMIDETTTTVTISTVTTIVSTTVTTADVSTSAATTSTIKAEKGTIKKIVDSVLTGDSFPVHTVMAVIAFSGFAAAYTFLFKRKDSEEESKNDD